MSKYVGYMWRRSARAKRLQVRITASQGVEVVIPRHTSNERVSAFLQQHRDWIHETWQRIREQVPDIESGLPGSLELRACNEHWKVRYRRRSGKQVRVTESENCMLTVFFDGRDEAAARRALRRWLAAKGRAVLTKRVDRLCALMGLNYRKLQIRGQKSRWGSCSSNKTLSLNYKLLFLEPGLVRYLIVHELSHLRVLNHSRRFWNVVAQYEPRWRIKDARLGEGWRDIPVWVERP